MCSAPTCHVTNVRPSMDSPHRVVILRNTPEYQYPWFRFYCDSIFSVCWMLQVEILIGGVDRLSRHQPQTRQPSPSPRHLWRQLRALPRALVLTSPPPSLRLPTLPPMPVRILPSTSTAAPLPLLLWMTHMTGGQGTRWCNQLSCPLSRLPQNHLCVRISRE